MKRNEILFLLIIFLLFLLLISQPQADYFWLSLFILVIICLPIFYEFHQRQLSSRELVMIALLGAMSAIARIPFAPLPSVQPSSFMIMAAAIVLGPYNGFVIGAMTALVSNIFLGQGPWTIWQVVAWGMMGFFTGLMRNSIFMQNKHLCALTGFIFGILFGWFMNLWVILSLQVTFSWEVILLYYTSSILFDLAHGVSNLIFLYLFSDSFIDILQRFKLKYGLFKDI